MPLLTENSIESSWVHQEIGFALASEVPVIPISIRGVMPGQMIGGVHAVMVDDPTADLRGAIEAIKFERILSLPLETPSLREVAESPEERAKLLGDEAEGLLRIGSFGTLRQLGALSSFSIPDKPLDDEVWIAREGLLPRSPYYHDLQRRERRVFERHVREKGFKIIIFPRLSLSRNMYPIVERLIAGKHLAEQHATTIVETAIRTRRATLRDFLVAMKYVLKEGQRRILISDEPLGRNVTMIGDWFAAESQRPKPGGYRQTVITRHSIAVRAVIAEFDDEFEERWSRKKHSYDQVIAALE